MHVHIETTNPKQLPFQKFQLKNGKARGLFFFFFYSWSNFIDKIYMEVV